MSCSRTQRSWGSNPGPLAPESNALPLSHRGSLITITNDVVYFEQPVHYVFLFTSRTHWVVIPNAVIPGKPLPVTVSFYNTSQDVQVRVDLIKDGHHLVTTKQHVFHGGKIHLRLNCNYQNKDSKNVSIQISLKYCH